MSSEPVRIQEISKIFAPRFMELSKDMTGAEILFHFFNSDSVDRGLRNIDSILFWPEAFFDHEDNYDINHITLMMPFPGIFSMADWELKLHADHYKLWVTLCGEDNVVKSVYSALAKDYSNEQVALSSMRIMHHQILMRQYLSKVTSKENTEYESFRRISAELEAEMRRPPTQEKLDSFMSGNKKYLDSIDVETNPNAAEVMNLFKTSAGDINIMNSADIFELKEKMYSQMYSDLLSYKAQHASTGQ